MLKQNDSVDVALETLSPQSDAWTVPLVSAKRDLAIETAIFSLAIGESFGMLFEGASPSLATKLASRWAKFDWSKKFPRRHGVMTFVAISAGQALLECRSSPTQFEIRFRRRMRGHRLARLVPSTLELFVPLGGPVSRGYRKGVLGSPDRLLPSVVFMSTVLQGTTNRISTWLSGLFAASSVKVEGEFELVAFSKLLARSAQAAIFNDPERAMDSQRVLLWLRDGNSDPAVLLWLDAMQQSLDAGENVCAFLKRVESTLETTVSVYDPRLAICSAIYVWLRQNADWKAGMIEAAGLGGLATSRCAIYSSLTALSSEGECLPLTVVERHRWWPISAAWMNKYVFRLLQWPHGEADLVSAHAVRSPLIGTLIAQPVVGVRVVSRRILNRVSSIFTRS